MSWVEASGDGVRIVLRVVPRASRTESAGVVGDALKIRLQAPPVDGKANRALARFLAARLGVPARAVMIVRGETSRVKTVDVAGVDVARAAAALTPS